MGKELQMLLNYVSDLDGEVFAVKIKSLKIQEFCHTTSKRDTDRLKVRKQHFKMHSG